MLQQRQWIMNDLTGCCSHENPHSLQIIRLAKQLPRGNLVREETPDDLT